MTVMCIIAHLNILRYQCPVEGYVENNVCACACVFTWQFYQIGSY